MPEIDFDNSYAKLPDVFFTQTTPTAVRAPLLFKFNNTLAKELGLDNLGTDDRELAERFSGNKLFNGSEPISMAYAGGSTCCLKPWRNLVCRLRGRWRQSPLESR